jgi:hypothetical protein
LFEQLDASRELGLKHQEKHSMKHYAGLDVSVKETSICIVDETGKIDSPAQKRGPYKKALKSKMTAPMVETTIPLISGSAMGVETPRNADNNVADKPKSTAPITRQITMLRGSIATSRSQFCSRDSYE